MSTLPLPVITICDSSTMTDDFVDTWLDCNRSSVNYTKEECGRLEVICKVCFLDFRWLAKFKRFSWQYNKKMISLEICFWRSPNMYLCHTLQPSIMVSIHIKHFFRERSQELFKKMTERNALKKATTPTYNDASMARCSHCKPIFGVQKGMEKLITMR